MPWYKSVLHIGIRATEQIPLGIEDASFPLPVSWPGRCAARLGGVGLAASIVELAAVLPALPRLALDKARAAAHRLALGVLQGGAALPLPTLMCVSSGVLMVQVPGLTLLGSDLAGIVSFHPLTGNELPGSLAGIGATTRSATWPGASVGAGVSEGALTARGQDPAVGVVAVAVR